MNRDRILVVAIVALSLVAIAAHFSSSADEYGRDNPRWNGTSQFSAAAERHGAIALYEYGSLPGRSDSMLLIIAPARGFAEAEIGACSEFLTRGNTIFIADDGRGSNILLEKLGSSVRIVPSRLRSIDRAFSHPDSILGYTERPDDLVQGVNAVVLNRPSYVTGGEALINTSVLTWEEKSGNYEVDAGETLTNYAIFTRETVNGGTVYVLADPSIFINGMQALDVQDNRQFIQNILATPHQVILDQVHCGGAAPIGSDLSGYLPGAGMAIKIIATVCSLAAIIYLFYSKIF
ncbi:MAG TPA: DUF4350 domain-containing protein [Methanoculleus sp.]|nr:DUF4350 domain-containing protein [Methanoculleus sp.]